MKWKIFHFSGEVIRSVYIDLVNNDVIVPKPEVPPAIAALVALTRRLVPGMVERGRGRVLNVGSVAAFQPGPGHAVYYATKAFVLSFSEALAHEADIMDVVSASEDCIEGVMSFIEKRDPQWKDC